MAGGEYYRNVVTRACPTSMARRAVLHPLPLRPYAIHQYGRAPCALKVSNARQALKRNVSRVK